MQRLERRAAVSGRAPNPRQWFVSQVDGFFSFESALTGQVGNLSYTRWRDRLETCPTDGIALADFGVVRYNSPFTRSMRGCSIADLEDS